MQRGTLERLREQRGRQSLQLLGEAQQLVRDGEFRQAEAIYQQILDRYCADPLQDTHTLSFTSIVHGNRAKLRANLENFGAAQEDYETALRLLRSVAQYNVSPQTRKRFRGQEIPPLMGIVEIFDITKQHANALKVLVQALQIAREAADPLQEATVLTWIGKTYQSQQKLDAAEKKLRDAQKLFEAHQEDATQRIVHQEYLRCCTVLGQVLSKLKRIGHARDILLRGLTFGEQRFGLECPNLQPLRLQLGEVFMRMGGAEDRLQATCHFRSWLQYDETVTAKVFGENRKVTRARTMWFMSQVEYLRGYPEQALRWLEMAEDTLQLVLGCDASQEEGAASSDAEADVLHVCLQSLRLFLTATTPEEKLEARMQEHDRHLCSEKDMGRTKINVAQALLETGRTDEALQWLDEAKQFLDGSHADAYHIALEIQADCLQDLGRNEEALAVSEECLRMKERDLGKENASTISARHVVCALLDTLERFDQAKQLTDVNCRMQHALKLSQQRTLDSLQKDMSGKEAGLMDTACALMSEGQQLVSNGRFTAARIAFSRALNRLNGCLVRKDIEDWDLKVVTCLCRRAECWLSITGGDRARNHQEAERDCEAAERLLDKQRAAHPHLDHAMGMLADRLVTLREELRAAMASVTQAAAGALPVQRARDLAGDSAAGPPGGQEECGAGKAAGKGVAELRVVSGGAEGCAQGGRNDDECPICMTAWASVTAPVFMLSCLHLACEECMMEWAKGCRRGFPADDMHCRIKSVPVTCPCCRAKVPGGATALKAACDAFARGTGDA